MKLPVQITFRHMEPSAALEANVREKAEKLDAFYDQIMACRVVVEAPHGHHHQGKLYHLRIDVTVPDGELVVSRESGLDHSHEDVYVAVRDAFDAMRRRLEDYARRRRQDVKSHLPPSHGHIIEIVPAEDFGRIETPDGREVYFHRNSVVGADFDRLELGTAVRFSEEAGEQGPQASTVHVVGKHHVAG